MAQEPVVIANAWEDLARAHVPVGSAFFEYIDSSFMTSIKAMTDVIDVTGADPLSVEKAEELLSIASGLHALIGKIQESRDGRTEYRDGLIYVHPLIRAVLGHHLRNDLYIIMLLLDAGGSTPQPVDSESVVKVSRSICAMAEFWERLKRITVRN